MPWLSDGSGCPRYPESVKNAGRAPHAALVLTLLSGAIALSVYDLYVLVTLTVGA